MNVSMIKNGATRLVARAGLKLNKYSPEILIGVGVVSVIGGVVVACKATLKAHEVVEEFEQTSQEIRDAIEIAEIRGDESYTQVDIRRDKAVNYIQTGWGFVKLYGPSILLVGGGIACFLASYGILHKRNVALMAAYEAVDKAFKEYRKRVIEDLGEEADKRYRYGFEKKELVEKEGTDEKEVVYRTASGYEISPSMYAKFFDESSKHWTKSPDQNLMFLHQQQNWANDLLRIRGHLFLNEVYDMLDIPRTQAGAQVGWVLGNGDDCVDFGIYSVYADEGRDERHRAFVNGHERSILLDFNVDGPIISLI